MKKIFLILICILPQVYFASGQSGYTLTIELQNVEVSEGTIRIALFNSQEAYENDKITKQLKVAAQKGVQTIVLKEIVGGEYVFKVHHDSNKNDEMDTNFFGIPKEGYAFSNNAKGSMGPASFEDAKFLLDKNMKQSISINY